MTDDQLKTLTRLQTQVEYLEKDNISLRTEIKQQKTEIINHVNELLKPMSEALKEIQATTKATAEIIATGKGVWRFIGIAGAIVMGLVGIGKLAFEVIKLKI